MLLKSHFEVDVDQPVDVVFTALETDMWHVLSGGVETEVFELSNGPIRVGSSYLTVVTHKGGRITRSLVRIDGYERARSIEVSWGGGEDGEWILRFGAAGYANVAYSPSWSEQGRYEVRFSSQGDRTRVKADQTLNLSGGVIPVSFFLRWPMRARIRRKLSEFRQAVEGGIAALV